MNISDYNKQKIGLLHTLFFKDILYNKQYVHADLHKGNIKIQNYKNFYKLVIYDFGFCLINNLQTFIKKMNIFIDIKNYQLLSELIYTDLIKKIIDYQKQNLSIIIILIYLKHTNKLDNNTFVILFLNYIIDNDYRIDNSIIEILLSSFIGYKYAFKNNIENAINITYSELSFFTTI